MIISMRKSLKDSFLGTMNSNKNSKSSNFQQLTKELGCQKGELLITLYTDNNGMVTIKDVPCDSYLIEIEESSNYQSSFLPVNFKTIETGKIVKKFVGLHKQPNSYVQVYVYFHDPVKKEDEMMTNTEVLIHSAATSSEEKLLFEEQETKMKLKENKNVLGRYEAVVVPGKYTLSVNKKGYDLIRKMININSGETKINVELIKEQSYNLKVSILNYTNMTPIENALIKLKFANDEECIEGISNSSGYFAFATPMKEDFVSIFVNKPGFLPGQRTYIRDVAGGGEQEAEAITREIIVLLVKESIVAKDNCMVMITYSNLTDDNFEPVYLYSRNSK
jgi:DNA uptake protein ComE-like DNA-binding protein